MNNNFLKFHEIKNNSILYINKNEIAIIDTDDSVFPDRNVSRIYFMESTDVSSFCVNETVEKIFINCNLDNFIRLHNYPTNNPILVNIDGISILDSETSNGNSNTKIFLRNSTNVKSFLVYESPDKIVKLIETLQNGIKTTE